MNPMEQRQHITKDIRRDTLHANVQSLSLVVLTPLVRDVMCKGRWRLPLSLVMTLILDMPVNVSVSFLIFSFSVSEYFLDLICRILYHNCDILVPMNRMGAAVHRFYTRLEIQGVIHPINLFRVDVISTLTHAPENFHWTLPQAAKFGCLLVKPVSVYFNPNFLTRLEHLPRVLGRETFHLTIVDSSQPFLDPFSIRS